MEVQIKGKNIEITDAMRQQIEAKLARLNKYDMIDDDARAKVVCQSYPEDKQIEITIPTKHAILRAEVDTDDMYKALDLAIDKLEDQMRRQKTRLSRKGKEKLANIFRDIEEYEEQDSHHKCDELVRTKCVVPEHMDVDEAIMRMEMLNHNFFIYFDIETNAISVVYKRKRGGYGCIETK